MTAVPPAGPPPIPPQNKVAPETLALRASPRPVTRLSRRALILLGSVSALTIAGLAIWALGVRHGGGVAPHELYSTDHKAIAEGLGTLPRDYGSLPPAPTPTVPQLGPPLPGDLGRPFLRAQQEGNVAPILAPTEPSAEEQAALAEKQRLRQEADAAARGQLFVQVRQRTDAAAPTGMASTATPPRPYPIRLRRCPARPSGSAPTRPPRRTGRTRSWRS